MPDGSDGVTVRSIRGIGEIAAADWDACAGPDNPFCAHAFLSAMEDSGSAATASGWSPRHLLIERPDGGVLACAPLYVKGHSYGEYVFDWAWADAWHKAGGRYYPKLQCAVPFTPVTGPRLLVHPAWRQRGLDAALAEAMTSLVDQAGLSSAHVTFSTQAEAEALAARGWLLRMGEQYHWTNQGYGGFDDFLGALSSRKRKSIRKERERASSLDVRIHTLTGDDLRPAHWEAFYRFYLDTIEKKWSNAYLTRDFFFRLGETMADRVVLIMAEKDGRWVAGALNLLGNDTLYGRNWGADGDFRYLHFEMCYYRAIDFAIANGLKKVEAGAQGEHKLSRGYMPIPTWSAHWIADPSFRRAVANFLGEERRRVSESIQELSEGGPYRHSDPCGE
ncbi:GNAT family N-acetyltransferase [Telmatospirillum siberiense]|uniref:GNAT family N-acetyltransferase n=1 Tax=Telmatospirillum siberiense TaxID=382514 RepID=A0A2N3PV29_9PROT|nr:GNAT family N-acetyltransferase [Telmatospirillum siberiense]PKU24252.1 GNAT family N-acetyltransferase [Telmatospirillum siberiense]